MEKTFNENILVIDEEKSWDFVEDFQNCPLVYTDKDFTVIHVNNIPDELILKVAEDLFEKKEITAFIMTGVLMGLPLQRSFKHFLLMKKEQREKEKC